MTVEVRPAPSAFSLRDLGPAPERQVARDLVKHGLIALPVALLAGYLIWGADGAASVAFAYGLVLANFALSAASLGWAAKVSLGLLMGVSLFGFLIRMALIGLAVFAVRDQPWVEPIPLGITLIVTHLGLLFWETRFVSATLAFPGLKPSLEER